MSRATSRHSESLRWQKWLKSDRCGLTDETFWSDSTTVHCQPQESLQLTAVHRSHRVHWAADCQTFLILPSGWLPWIPPSVQQLLLVCCNQQRHRRTATLSGWDLCACSVENRRDTTNVSEGETELTEKIHFHLNHFHTQSGVCYFQKKT